MGKYINLNSQEWGDIVFEGKNKKYGAYRLRQSSSKRHIAAFIVILIFTILVAVVPEFIGFMQSQLKAENLGAYDEAFEMTNMEKKDKPLPEQNIIKQEIAPPPPPLKSSIAFMAPVIADDDDVQDEQMMKAQDDLASSRIQISVADIAGSNDPDAIDISELDKHKVIIQAEPEKEVIHTTVEQMPSYPTGETEMYKFISNNLNYPMVALESGLEGRVYVRFVVGRDGGISNVEIVRSLSPDCDREAMRVIRLMPKWIPGKQNGRAVPVYFSIPILYRITN